MIAFLEPVRLRYDELSRIPASSSGCSRVGAEKAAAAAAPTLEAMYDRMGFVRP